MSFSERYRNLNREQRLAVDQIDGPLLVVAGPGTGKTELLGVRIANILKKTDTPPGSILCLTYTESASVNMRERLIELIGEDAYRVSVHTFHAFCQRIIEEYPEEFHDTGNFFLADEAIQTKILEEILDELDHGDPLSAFHPSKGFVYLRDISKAFLELKDSGLSPNDLKNLIDHNEKVLRSTKESFDSVFNKRVGKNSHSEVKELVKELYEMKTESLIPHVKPLNEALAISLSVASGDDNLSEWKKKRTVKKAGKRVLKEFQDLEKMRSLEGIYKEYRKRMHERGYYDFSDMILDVIERMEYNEDLRDEVRERFFYVMVDEFQDTSGVQMRFLDLLMRSDEDESPNICVVGDDDQAIYKFQGAEVSNILEFKDSYQRANAVTLKRNYRSLSRLIDVALNVIKKGERRLENIYDDIKKELIPNNKGKGEISYKRFKSEEEEFSFVAKEVKKLMKNTSPEEIAIIGRKHESLVRILPFLNGEGIPVSYERKEEVLRKKHILQIIGIMRFCNAFLKGDSKEYEEFLPEILSYPFWNVKKEKIWKISLEAFYERLSWIDCMKRDPELKDIADFLIDTAVKSKSEPAEEVIDIIIGNKKGAIKSPYKDHYFSNELFKEKKEEYLSLLSSLRCFVGAVRKHKPLENIKVSDLLEYFDIMEKNEIPLIDNDPLVGEDNAVALLTAHSAKGKEFESVFVLNCDQDNWAGGRAGGRIDLPMNTPYKRAGEERDDKLRLFYVALTRAKKYLSLTCYGQKRNGRECIPLEFLNDLSPEKTRKSVNLKGLDSISKESHQLSLVKEEKDLLLPLVKEHKLSATGFTKFLNVAEEGPISFFEENILRFPKKKELPLSYGTAIHGTLAEVHMELKEGDGLPSEKRLLEVFEKHLLRERLSERNYQKLFKRGKDSLLLFYKQRKDFFDRDSEIEKNFKDQGCFVDDVGITGKIDKMIKKGKEIEVTDFKTGKPLQSWNNELKSWKYKYQLIFYKILIESSRDFNQYRVRNGLLEFVEPDKEGNIILLPLEIDEEEAREVRELIRIVGKKIKNLDFPSTEEYKSGSLKDVRNFTESILKEET